MICMDFYCEMNFVNFWVPQENKNSFEGSNNVNNNRCLIFVLYCILYYIFIYKAHFNTTEVAQSAVHQ